MLGFKRITVIVAACLLALPLSAQERRIVVVGQGSVTAQPDLGVVTTGVTTIAKTAAEALQQNSEQMTKVLQAAMDAGIANKDVQTSQIMLHPRYGNRASQSEPKIEGYQATNTVTLRIRNISEIGTVLDAVSRAGANNIGNIGFSVQSPEPLILLARKEAVVDARAKANLYAEASGVELGEVLLIEEPGGSGAPVHRMAHDAAMLESVPVMAGETNVTAQIRMVFGIK